VLTRILDCLYIIISHNLGIFLVPCGFGDISQCLWNATAWNMTDSATPSNETGPEQGVRLRGKLSLYVARISQLVCDKRVWDKLCTKHRLSRVVNKFGTN
jgi:hypothetical protein